MIQIICWVLIHSLWQGLLLSLAGGVVILCSKRSAAAVRYRLLCGLFGLFMAGVAATFFYEWGAISGTGEGDAAPGMSMNRLADWCSAHAYPIVVVWLMVAAARSVRMATAWSYIWRMRREGLAAPSLWAERMAALSRKLGIRRTVKLVESGLVKVPIVIGQLKPIVYIPLGLINHLPAGEMEAVLLHELAHVRRYDHAMNMVQQVAECLLFFNPGFLWISYLMREERENCCDDTAIGCTKDRVEFVRALVRFKEHSLRGAALAFPGNKRQLLHRVLRISRRENKTLSGRELLILLGGCVVLLCLLAARVDRVAGTPAGVRSLVAIAKEKEKEPRIQAVQPVSPELVAVLRTRQQVAQNMEWVQGQLKQLHHQAKRHQSGIGKNENGKNDEAKNDEAKNANAKNEEKEVTYEEDAQQDKVQTQQGQEGEAQNREQAERDRQQADRDREQAGRDREQAERDKQQADRDREQAMRDREQAMRDRQQAQRDRQAAELERAQSELQRREAELDRLKHKVIDQHQ